MARRREDKPRGLLNRRESEKRFSLDRYQPSGALVQFVEHSWVVHWDLTGQAPYVQQNLPYPSVHIVFEKEGSCVYGVVTGRFTRRLEGKSRVLGIKLRPGGFYPFIGFPVSRITNRTLPLQTVFGEDAPELARAILETEDDDGMIRLAEAALLAVAPQPDTSVDLVSGIVDAVQADRTILTVETLARRSGMSCRSLQRLFNRYVGVSPKWVIARYRLFEAAEMLEGETSADLGALAAQLGYFDQAHFIKDFRRLVGSPPAAYARRASPSAAS